MPRKKHPILMVLIILLVAIVFLSGTMALVFKLTSSGSALSFGQRIGVVTIEGTILASQAITSEVEKFKKDDGIKAILLRIDSPGGAIGPTQEIYREVRKAAQTKTVVASLGTVAASGGYYVAAAADKVVANPGTITGSIGVLMEFIRVQELLGKVGITLEVLKSGEFKDIGSPHRNLTERDREILGALMKEIQQQFVEAVADGRGLSTDAVNAIADGRIFSGAQAKGLGLVDELGNFQDAVELAKMEAGIKGDVSLVYPQKRLGLWDTLFKSTLRSLISAFQETQMRASYRWDGFPASGLTEN